VKRTLITILFERRIKRNEMGKTRMLATRSNTQVEKPTLEPGKAPMAISRGAMTILKIIMA